MNQKELKNITISLTVAVQSIIKSTCEADSARVAKDCAYIIKQVLKDNPKLKDSVERLLIYSQPDLKAVFYEWIELQN